MITRKCLQTNGRTDGHLSKPHKKGCTGLRRSCATSALRFSTMRLACSRTVKVLVTLPGDIFIDQFHDISIIIPWYFNFITPLGT